MCMKYVRISTLSPVHFTVTFTVHHQLVVLWLSALVRVVLVVLKLSALCFALSNTFDR